MCRIEDANETQQIEMDLWPRMDLVKTEAPVRDQSQLRTVGRKRKVKIANALQFFQSRESIRAFPNQSLDCQHCCLNVV